MARLTEAQVGQLRELPLGIQLPGPEPWTLDDPEAFWVVMAGGVEVFAQAVPAQGPGHRRHLLSLEPGQVLAGGCRFAVPAPWKVVAVATGETRLLVGRLETLPGPARSDLWNFLMGSCLELCLAAVSERVRSQDHPPLQAILAPDLATVLPAGARAAIREARGWLRVQAGQALLQGGLALDPGHGPFPLARGLWLQAGPAGATVQMLGDQDLPEWAGRARVLDHLLDWVMAWESRRLDLEEQAALDRLHLRVEAESGLRHRALAALVHLAMPGERPPTPGADGDALLAVCRRVGETVGILFQAPPRWQVDAPGQDPLGAISRASRVRTRQVALRGAWWEHDGGPLLGYLEASRTPVALLPVRGGYTLEDASGAPVRRLDPDLAAQLEPFAHTFYRPAPNRAMNGWDLAHLALDSIRADLVWVLALSLASGALGLALPMGLAAMASQVIPQAQLSQVWVLGATLAGLSLGVALFGLARALALIRLEGKTGSALQSVVVDRLLALPVAFFKGQPVGDLAKRALAVDTIHARLTGAAVTGLLSGVFTTLNLGFMFVYEPLLATMVLGLTVLVAVAWVVAARYRLRIEPLRQAASGQLSAVTFQMLQGIAKLRVAAAEGRALAVWCQSLGVERGLEVAINHGNLALRVGAEMLPVLATLALFIALDLRFHSVAGSSAGFLAFLSSFGTYFGALAGLGVTLVGLLDLGPLMDRAQPILQAVPEDHAERQDPGRLTGLIEAQHLDFRYQADGPQILQDVSFQARPGEFVAFVGPSGSGKSTSLRLLLGFEQPETGTIHYDQQDLTSLDMGSLRCQIGVVLQSSRLLSGSLFQNIVGSSLLDQDAAWAAAEAAGLADDIRQMPMGMHTMVSEGGSTFSGGQRQRLLIARALARKPRILFFDEATSALDNRTQAIVSRSLERLNATRIVIAHRLSTIQHADRIYVMDRGRIVQTGTYDSLQAEPGLFRLLVERQRT